MIEKVGTPSFAGVAKSGIAIREVMTGLDFQKSFFSESDRVRTGQTDTLSLIQSRDAHCGSACFQAAVAGL